eukprot:2269216-Rhodomonas_salina.2
MTRMPASLHCRIESLTSSLPAIKPTARFSDPLQLQAASTRERDRDAEHNNVGVRLQDPGLRGPGSEG